MGYFDALTASSFKQVDGQRIFYPWGTLGRGYVIPSEERFVEIQKWLKRSFQFWLPLVIIVAAGAGWAYTTLLLPVFGVWYIVKIRGITRDLQPTAIRLSLRESHQAQAAGHSMWMLSVLMLVAVSLVIAGIAILALEPGRWIVAMAGIVFFGACAVSIGAMIRARLRPGTR